MEVSGRKQLIILAAEMIPVLVDVFEQTPSESVK